MSRHAVEVPLYGSLDVAYDPRTAGYQILAHYADDPEPEILATIPAESYRGDPINVIRRALSTGYHFSCKAHEELTKPTQLAQEQ